MPTAALKEKIKQFFGSDPAIYAVYLFGSAVEGKTHSSSDIDIAILCAHENIPSYHEQMEKQNKLTDILNKQVDLVCLNVVTPILQKQVLSKGEKVLVNDPHELNLFIIKALNMYYDLKMTRKPIEQMILQRRILNG